MGKNRKKMAILFLVMALTALLVVELYIMINDSQSYVNMVIVAVIMLVLVYLLVSQILRQSEERQKKMEELYEDVLKSQKASYLLLRKHFTAIEKQIGEVRNEVKTPKDEIISIQKAIAKITISRSKENTDALMNSNDRLMKKVYDFENLMEQSNKDQLVQQREMLAEVGHELKELLVNLETELQEQTVKVMDEPEITPDADFEDVENFEEEVLVEPDIILTEEEEEDVIAEPELIPTEDEEAELMEEPELTLESEITAEPELTVEAEGQAETQVSDDPNKMMGPDDIAALLASMQNEPAEEAIAEPEPTPEPQPKSALETLAKHPAPAPEADDPNKMMGPDDIAALLASMQNEPAAEAITEPEPTLEPEAPSEPEIAAEPEPALMPAPDADPNRKMTPEEIAALLANM